MTPEEMKRQWLLKTLESLKATEDAGLSEKVGDAVEMLCRMGALPGGDSYQMIGHVLAEAEAVLGRKPVAADFAGQPLADLTAKAKQP